MKAITRLAIMIAAACLALPASAAFFQFSYTFEANRTGTPGHALEGVIEGELQDDGDTIVIDRLVTASLAGIAFPLTENAGIRHPDQTLPPVMSLSGDTLDFWICPQGFTFDYGEPFPGGDCSFGSEGGFLITDSFDFRSSTVGERAHAGIPEFSVDGFYRDSDAPINRAGWRVEEVSRAVVEYTYMFEANVRGVPGHQLNGTVEGLLLADGDTFLIQRYLEADLDFAPYLIDEENIGIRAADPDAPALLTISGERLDFFVCPLGFTGEFLGGGDCPFGAEGGFLVSDDVNFFGNDDSTAWAGIPAFGPGFRDGDSPIQRNNWSAEITQVFTAKDERKRARQQARDERKAARAEAREERKATRAEQREARKAARAAERQARKAARAEARAARDEARS